MAQNPPGHCARFVSVIPKINWCFIGCKKRPYNILNPGGLVSYPTYVHIVKKKMWRNFPTLQMLWFLNPGSQIECHKEEFSSVKVYLVSYDHQVVCIKRAFHHSIADCSSCNNSWMHKLNRVGLKFQLSLTPYPCVKDLDFYCLIYSFSLSVLILSFLHAP